MTFTHSNASYIQLLKNKNAESIVLAIRRIFEYLNGIPQELMDCFSIVASMKRYSQLELFNLVMKFADAINVEITKDATLCLVKYADGSYRNMENIIKRATDFALIRYNSIIDSNIANTVIKTLDLFRIASIKDNLYDRKDNFMKQRILFCNIAYMRHYDTNYPEIPENGGKYVQDEKDALEKHNFEKCSDGYYRGFVETKHSKGYKLGIKLNEYKSLRIENIDNSYVKQMSIPNVLVVFCAKKKDVGTVIVGWYKGATVYRRRPEYNGRAFNIMTRIEDGVLLEEEERTFLVPRVTKEVKIGFGQSNVWYAKKPEHQFLITKVVEYVNNYKK